MRSDTRQFPQHLRVWVKNDNAAEPDSDDRFSGHCTFQMDGELWDFPPSKGVLLTPEQAWWMFLWDCRSEINARGEDQGPRNFRDKHSTAAVGNSGIGSQITLWQQKLAALGWEKAPNKAKRFDNFSFVTVNMNQVISSTDFQKIAGHKAA